MPRLLTGPAVGFNLRYRRSGPLFQKRYKSLLCLEDPYLLELVRVIHLNPLRAGLVKELQILPVYPWRGHAVLLGERIRQGQCVGDVLAHFGKGVKTSRAGYAAFFADGVSLEAPNPAQEDGLRCWLAGRVGQRGESAHGVHPTSAVATTSPEELLAQVAFRFCGLMALPKSFPREPATGRR